MAITISNNNECETIDVTTDLILELDNPGNTLEFIASYNCCNSTIVTVDLSDPNISRVGNVITVLPALFDFNTDGVFKDGIYSFTVKVVADDFTYTLEKNCYFVDCETLCTLSEGDTDKILIHYALSLSNNCGCDCSNICDLYKKLIEDTTNGCNC